MIGPLGSVDEIGVQLVLGRPRADAQQPVLGVQKDLGVGAEIARNEVGNADAEVHDLPWAELLGGPFGDQGLGVGSRHVLATSWST